MNPAGFHLLNVSEPAAPARTGGRMTGMGGLDSTRTGGRTQARIAGRVTRMAGRISQNMQADHARRIKC